MSAWAGRLRLTMRIHLEVQARWDRLESSLWFRPTLLSVAAAGLAVAMVAVDRALGVSSFALLNAGADDARALLSSITSSMLTVTTVTFSIIMVALVLASQQFSPRIIRNFMRDSTSQYVLGIFIGTFIYSLLVLGRISDTNNSLFVPVVSIAVAVLLTLLSIGTFIYFIHHIAEAIQANTIVAGAGEKTVALLDKLFPEQLGQPAPPPAAAAPPLPTTPGAPIAAPKPGYIQEIDPVALLGLACQHDRLIRLERAIGDFVPQGNSLLRIWPEHELGDDEIRALQDVFEIGSERTLFDDILFGIRQLVDIALKAISPAINDPSTAVNCIDYLGNILVQAARRSDPELYRYDQSGRLRVIAQGVTFEQLVDGAFSQIRQYASSEVAVTLRLLKTLHEIAQATADPARTQVLWRHAQMIARGAALGIPEPHDRQQINQAVRLLAQQIGTPPGAALLAVDEATLAL